MSGHTATPKFARPAGSNADEWHLFLSRYLDNRAMYPTGLTYVALQIAEALDPRTAKLGQQPRTATVVLPSGYATAEEFAKDCGFELSDSHAELVKAMGIALSELDYIAVKHGYVSTETAAIQVRAALATLIARKVG